IVEHQTFFLLNTPERINQNIRQRYDACFGGLRLLAFQPNQRTLQVNLAPLDLDRLADPHSTIIQECDEWTKMRWQFGKQVFELRMGDESLSRGRLFQHANYRHELNLAVNSRDVKHPSK